MDTRPPCAKVSRELARELLIAISYCSPENVLNSGFQPENTNKTNGVSLANGDGAERYRSELISISYAESPDALTPPVAPRNHLA
ncbi:hypothetical protein SLEP1_g9042 [Rubroshorea leprosula]|uniref:Uncharacterized protein n=1 Tax=Rubroshorea leprosula TaxID=152421 RepID=A0AAV5I9L3_9ROSI|nr:hypothetical protein SLEP1_g9042 [Rubroshorea leprosula]